MEVLVGQVQGLGSIFQHRIQSSQPTVPPPGRILYHFLHMLVYAYMALECQGYGGPTLPESFLLF